MTKIDNETAESAKLVERNLEIDEVSSGSLLQIARENSGFSIERAAMATRIARPFIEALESDQLEKLPGAVFGRGFIRNLCKVYGADSEPILAAFDSRSHIGHGRDPGPSIRDERRHQQLKKGVLLIQPNEWKKRFKALAPHHYLRAKPLVLIVGAVVLIGLIINQFKFSETSQKATELKSRGTELAKTGPTDLSSKQASNPSPIAVPPAAVPSAAEPNKGLPLPQTGSPSAAFPLTQGSMTAEANKPAITNDPESFEASGPADVELRVKEPVNVKITKDEEKAMSGQLKPDIYRYRFKNSLKLFIEDVAAVEVFFRGQKIPTSTVKGESKRLGFTSSESQIAKKPSPSPL